MTGFHTPLHFPDVQLASPCPVLLMLNTRLEVTSISFASHWFDLTFCRGSPCSTYLITTSGDTDRPTCILVTVALYSAVLELVS